MTVSLVTNIHRYIGVSGDVKPTGVLEGSTFYETNTEDTYVYSAAAWTLAPAMASSNLTNDEYLAITGGSVPAAANVFVTTSALATALTAALVTRPLVTYKFAYDFAVLGGAVGSIPLTAPYGLLPDKFIITNAILDVITGFTGGVACSGAVTTGQGAGDLVAAAAVAGAPYSTTGLKATLVLPATLTSQIKTTAQRTPAFVVAATAVTAGKFNLFVSGFLSD